MPPFPPSPHPPILSPTSPQPDKYLAARRSLELKRQRLVRNLQEREAEVEDVRRSAQTAADSASRLTVIMQRNQREWGLMWRPAQGPVSTLLCG